LLPSAKQISTSSVSGGSSPSFSALSFSSKISTNLVGTTYYSLVGLHAFHVTVGLIGLLTVLLLALFGKIHHEHSRNVDVFAMYWHFVDVVWIVVFTVVYVIGR
jgi:cytochrome c oxidase subunit 3/cytochrome o ubiquinol oxidase subunit 3